MLLILGGFWGVVFGLSVHAPHPRIRSTRVDHKLLLRKQKAYAPIVVAKPGDIGNAYDFLVGTLLLSGTLLTLVRAQFKFS